MNMSAMTMNRLASAKAVVSSAVKPAVRSVADSKSALRKRCSGGSAPRVSGLPHSVSPMSSAPPTSSAAVVARTSLVSSVMRPHRRFNATSPTIAKPRPPRVSSLPTVSRTTQSSTNGLRLRNPPVMSNPALLKALMAWNTPHQMPSGSPGGPASGPEVNASDSTTAPRTSHTIVKSATRRTTSITLPSCRPPSDSCTTTRSRSEVRRPRKRASRSVEPAMMPKPPAWIRSRMTIWPNGLQCVAVSSTVSPVTQAALVAVKSASIGRVAMPLAAAIGSMRSAVPTAMRTTKRRRSERAGDGADRKRRGGRIVMRCGEGRSTRTVRSPGRRGGRGVTRRSASATSRRRG